MTISKNVILHNIQKRGSWLVCIRPSTFEKERLEIDDCLKLVQSNQVSLRGWNYPHYHEAGTADGGISTGVDYIQCITDYKAHKEIWRMHQSGLFAHRFACEEDWWQ